VIFIKKTSRLIVIFVILWGMFWLLLFILPLCAINIEPILDKELKAYSKINRQDIEKFRRSSPEDLKYYAIQNGKVIGNGKLLPLLNALKENFSLPNVEFLYYEGELPNPPKKMLSKKFPILAASKSKDNSRVCILPFKVLKFEKDPLEWQKRDFKISVEDPKITPYIKNHPDLITSFLASNKYQLLTNPDHLSNSLIFFVDKEKTIWPSLFLEPWVHYIPVQKNLSDLMYQVGWALSHDKVAERIAKDGATFIEENLNEKLLYTYAYELLCRLSVLEGE